MKDKEKLDAFKKDLKELLIKYNAELDMGHKFSFNGIVELYLNVLFSENKHYRLVTDASLSVEDL